jgi:type II secretory pathway pseudopilin PulG
VKRNFGSLGDVYHHSNFMSSETTSSPMPPNQTPAPSPPRGWLRRSWRPVTLLSCVLIGLSALGTLLFVQSSQHALQAREQAQVQMQAFNQAVQQAKTQGYTQQDLAPITDRAQQIGAMTAPIWFWSRPGFYTDQATSFSQLRGSLAGWEQRLIDDTKVSIAKNVDDAKKETDKDQQAGVDDATLTDLRQRVDEVTKNEQAAKAVTDFRKTEGDSRQLLSDAQAAGKAQVQENAVVKTAADQLIKEKGGDVGALQQIAQDSLNAARNDASVAAYLNFGSFYQGGTYLDLNVAYHRLEHYSGEAGSSDVNQVALAAAAGQRYASQIHDWLYKAMPAKTIIISIDAQELWAYQNGQVVQDTPVTTGRPDSRTDEGPLHVLRLDHPWTMKSPWPPGNPLWYPDTVVQWAIWVTNTGEAIHDAYWQPSGYGRGSENNPSTESHGCIHTPLNSEIYLYNWVTVGMPVMIYPGDNSPVENQMSQMTTDKNGIPPNGEGFRGGR